MSGNASHAPHELLVRRLSHGDEQVWVDAVGQVISPDERDGQLISAGEAIKAIADDRCYLVIAQIEGETIGILTAYRFPDLEAGGAPLVYLYDAEVQNSHRRSGVGKVMLKRAVG